MALTNYEQTADESGGDKNGKTGAGRGSGKPAGGGGGVGAGRVTVAIFKVIIVCEESNIWETHLALFVTPGGRLSNFR